MGTPMSDPAVWLTVSGFTAAVGTSSASEPQAVAKSSIARIKDSGAN